MVRTWTHSKAPEEYCSVNCEEKVGSASSVSDVVKLIYDKLEAYPTATQRAGTIVDSVTLIQDPKLSIPRGTLDGPTRLLCRCF